MPEEQATADFAHACVVSVRDIHPLEFFDRSNIWVKRPGTGQIKAEFYPKLMGKRANKFIRKNTQLEWSDIVQT